jgi:hypothetical protein
MLFSANLFEALLPLLGASKISSPLQAFPLLVFEVYC